MRKKTGSDEHSRGKTKDGTHQWTTSVRSILVCYSGGSNKKRDPPVPSCLGCERTSAPCRGQRSNSSQTPDLIYRRLTFLGRECVFVSVRVRAGRGRGVYGGKSNNYFKGWCQKSTSSLASLRVLAHRSPHPRGSKMKVSRWVEEEEEEGRGRDEGLKRGGNTPGRALVSIPPLHPRLSSSSPPPKKKHSFHSSSSRSPPNPSLLPCICFLIRSVWEAHEPPPPQPPPPASLSVAVTLQHASIALLLVLDSLVFRFAARIIRQRCSLSTPT
ncbi:hypothetical protein Q8A73_000268 [Channa argus]|nr:hypothetical protein Q8A73_000268 [Channa argus]